MRKILLIPALLILGISCLCGCDVAEMSSLADLSKPYAGFYECETVLLGGEDMTDRFEYIRLELEYGGGFTLSYRGTDGSEGSYGGTYETDLDAEEITLRAKSGLITKSFTFPMVDGCIFVDLPFGGKLLHAEFAMP